MKDSWDAAQENTDHFLRHIASICQNIYLEGAESEPCLTLWIIGEVSLKYRPLNVLCGGHGVGHKFMSWT